MGSELRLKEPESFNKAVGGAVFEACSSASSSELPGHLLASAQTPCSHPQDQGGLRDGSGGFAKPGLLRGF